MSLQLKGVSYVYAAGQPWQQAALADVSLTVETGEMVLVVGATGSGKSTLLRIAAGLLAPSSGEVLLDGDSVSSATRGTGVGIVFQDPESQLFAETVVEDVAFGPMNTGHAKPEAIQLAREALEQVGLDPSLFAERSPFGLSGGEARRAALAGVLSMQPRYVLADEPTAGLDASGRAAVGRILTALRERAGVVVVTHDAEQFLDDADTVLVLREGRTAFQGSVDALLENADALSRQGLRPPPLVDVQLQLRARGLALPRLSLDTSRVAADVAAALAGPGAAPCLEPDR